MKKRFFVLTVAAILGVNSLAFNAFATSVNNQNNHESQKREKLERPERAKNEVFGKITDISENSVTISIVEIKKPENGNKQDKANPPERKQLTEEQIAEMKKNIENMFTLTGETKTIDISTAKFDNFGRRPRDGKNDATTNNNENVNKVEKTYKDYQVGDYVSIELESENSSKAKTVRDAFKMRGGMPRGNWGRGFKKERQGKGSDSSNN